MENILFEAETFNSKKVMGCYVFGYEKGKEIHTIVNQTEKQKVNGEFTSNIVKKETVRLIKDKIKMEDFMLQQLLGFRLGKNRYSITELIISAGLTKQEWLNIKNEIDVKSLEKSDIEEIEDYFKKDKIDVKKQ